jgi:hypothetical protein
MTRCASWVALGLLVLLPAGCKRDRTQTIAASYSSATRPTQLVGAPVSAVGVASIPVEEEYEERSASAITQANLSAQVAEIEKEIR